MLDDPEQKAQQAIRERAYALWQQAGSPEGREDEFWQRAEAEGAGEAALDEDIIESFPASDATNRS